MWAGMAKRGRHPRRGGRVTPKGTRPEPSGRTRHLGLAPPPDESAPDDLMGDVRDALRSGEPLDLLALASTMMSVFDSRLDDPFARGPQAGRPDFEELVMSFLEVRCPETTALLAVLAELVSAEGPASWSDGARPGRPARHTVSPTTVPGLGPLDAAAIRRAVLDRGDRLPGWVARLGDAEVTSATEMVHVLGDGDNVIVGLRIPPRHELSVVVYIDHNLGRVVKDAFVVPDSPDGLIRQMRQIVDDPDTEWRDVPLADARALITDAVDSGAMTWPPFETDTWPACRPLVEWVVRLMPGGATVEGPHRWTDDETARLAASFLATPEGVPHRSRAGRDMLDALLWYGTGYGKCDPLRWSPVSVEIVLADWVPRKVLAPVDELRLVPDVLRDLVRFGHRELGIRQELTDETVDAVDAFESAYLALIRSPRPQGVDALIQSMSDAGGFGDGDAGFRFVPGDDLADLGFDVEGDPFASIAEIMLDSLARDVGGPEVLRVLDDSPLPDELFDVGAVPSDVAGPVGEIVVLCDGWYDELGVAVPSAVELRTATRRLLAVLADRTSGTLVGRAATASTAASVCWAVASANVVFDGRPGSPRGKDLIAHFGRSGTPSSRARSLLHAAGLGDRYASGPVVLPPEMLSSARRSDVIAARDRWLADL